MFCFYHIERIEGYKVRHGCGRPGPFPRRHRGAYRILCSQGIHGRFRLVPGHSPQEGPYPRMSDSPLRSGRPLASGTSDATLTELEHNAPEPVGPSIPSGFAAARATPDARNNQVREHTRPALSRTRPRPPETVEIERALPIARIVSLAAVLALLIGAIWLDRDNHQPVAGFGMIATPGTTNGLVRAPEEGEPAPNFRLRTSEGGVVELASLQGEVVVLHFWTTWCFECRAELESLQALTGQDGVTVLGIDAGERASRVNAAADDFGLTYTQLLDVDREVSQAYGAWSYPATVVIGADGVVQTVAHGPMPPDALEEAVDIALAGG